MTKKLRDRLSLAIAKKADLDRHAKREGGFAYELAARSMASHIDELTQQILLSENLSIIEKVEFRFKSQDLHDGSIPLHLLSKVTENIRQMIGHAALRVVKGGMVRKRVSEDLYNELDIRLATVLPGSSRLVITTASNRDLLDDGIAKSALNRIFNVLNNSEINKNFLESVADLGPSSARRLRSLLQIAQTANAEVDISWEYAGKSVSLWNGTHENLTTISDNLNATKITSAEEIDISGNIELLSKKERIHVRTINNATVKILFPQHLLPAVSELHLDQNATLRCSVTEVVNPLTDEKIKFYELLRIIG